MPSTATFLAIPALLALCFVSYHTMHLQPVRNQYASVIEALIKDPAPRFLPDTDRLLLRHYTGIEKVDQLLTLLNIVFAHTADWSRPEFSLYCLHFSGQATAFYLVFHMEALRVGSRWTLIWGPFAAFWGMAAQLYAYQCALPIFAIIHLLTVASKSRKADAVRLADPVQVQALVPGFLLGLVLPTVLCGIPFESSEHRQIVNAVWQIFPVLVYVVSVLFAFLWKRSSVGVDMHKSPAARDRAAVDSAYKLALISAAISQWTALGALLLARVAPELLPAGWAERLTWSNVFLPTTFISHQKYESAGQVVHDMLRWDQILGSVSALIWATTLCVETGGVEITPNTFSGIIKDSIAVGPGGALVNLLRARDEGLLKEEEKAEVKKIR